MLERLSDAERNGRTVLGLVRGSAVNQDGASNGLTAPNGPAQQRVIAQALANAQLSAGQVDAVEAHGTGTTLGRSDRGAGVDWPHTAGIARERPLWLGSVKSNIGHTQAAAGVAGVIKMVLAMRHGVLPKTLHVDEPSTKVDWSSGAVSLLRENVPWEKNGEPRRAGVSSFGIGGTNAHLILEEAPSADAVDSTGSAGSSEGGSSESPDAPSAGAEDARGARGAEEMATPTAARLLAGDVLPFVLSGRSEAALREQGVRLRERLEGDLELGLMDVGSALTGRSVFEHRAVVLGGARDDLSRGLSALAAGETAGGVIRAPTAAVAAAELGFLFTGQGAQRAGMGADLYGVFPVFREALDELCAQFDRHLEHPLRDVLFAESHSERSRSGIPDGAAHVAVLEVGLLDRTLYTQTALFALEVALFRLVESLGVRPAYLLGHSIGELVAAHVAGVLSVQDACTLVAARGRLMEELPEGGAMVSIQASEQEVALTLDGLEGRVALAAVNGPASVVISGDERDVLEVADVWVERGAKTKRLRVSHAFHSPRMDAMLDGFSEVAHSIAFEAPRIAIVSNLTGELVTAERVCTPEYWVEHVRRPVRFADGVRWLAERGVRRFLELGPDGVLSAMIMECLSEGHAAGLGGAEVNGRLAGDGGADVTASDGEGVVAAPLLRGERPQVQALIGALSALWVGGGEVAWSAFFAGLDAKRVELPTYAFQREHHWLNAQMGGRDMASVGLMSAEHPLLNGALALADGRGWLFTGRVSLEAHPWLADHAVLGRVLLPSTALLELALHVGDRLGVGVVEELSLDAPLILSERESVVLQLAVGEVDAEGRHSLGIYSRPVERAGEGALYDSQWTRHASGVLAADEAGPDRDVARETATLIGGESWPPEGCQVVDVDGLYDRLAGLGLEYGPVFQGLHRAWRRGDEVFAEVVLCVDGHEQTAPFGVHPALLEGALHIVLDTVTDHPSEACGPLLPSAFKGARLHAASSSSLRVKLSPVDGDATCVVIADETGELVASIDSLAKREISTAQLRVSRDTHRDALFTMDWAMVPIRPAARGQDAVLLGEGVGRLTDSLTAAGCSVEVHKDLRALGEALDSARVPPKMVVFECVPGGEEPASEGFDGARVEGGARDEPAAMHNTVHRALSVLQQWLADERFADSRLVLLTKNGMAVRAGECVSGLVQSPIWGLVRSAQSESPERFALVDVDDHDASWGALADALALGEPQLALREGMTCLPRLARAKLTTGEVPPALDPQSTVLVTGGTGGLGGVLARHLVLAHGAGHLLLVSRRGEAAEGAPELKAELQALGAEVSIVACDVGDRAELAGLFDSVAQEHPLGAVVHAAGVLDDGVIGSLTPERLDVVLKAKADAAWHLHELTAHMGLAMFVLCSSAASTIGNPGQGNYAAANGFLDALAAHRRAQGLAATAIAWGPWEQTGGMAASLSDADRLRLERSGIATLSVERGLSLLDSALSGSEALAIGVPLKLAALRTQARSGMLPAIFAGLIRVPRLGAREQGDSLARRLAAAPQGRRAKMLLEVVRGQTAGVLGHPSPEAIPARQVFKDLGFDSLTALELRNRLSLATGLRLPATLVFDYATPAAVAEYLLSEMGDSADSITGSDPDAAVREAIAAVPLSRLRRAGLVDMILELADSEHGETPPDLSRSVDQIETMDIERLARMTLENARESVG